MPITPIENYIQIPGRPKQCTYFACDGAEFSDLEEAVEYDNKLHDKDKPPVTYDYVLSIQEAINMAVAENRVVRFFWNKPNAEIRKGIVDIKNCKLVKKDKESTEVAVVPPSVKDFCF